MKQKFMFKSFEEYAEIFTDENKKRIITPSHPNWEAFKIIWKMSRTPAFADLEEETNDN